MKDRYLIFDIVNYTMLMKEGGEMYNFLSNEKIKENLIDIDCDENQINSFIEYLEEDNLNKMFKLLKIHRYNILDKIHVEQRKLDHLDYLVYQLKKEKIK